MWPFESTIGDFMNTRNHTVDLMRFFAAAWVVLFHLSYHKNTIEGAYNTFINYGFLGVPIFFVISGYCILMVALHAKNPFEFIIRRLFRIFPAFWFSIFIVFAAAAFQKIAIGANSVTAFPNSITKLLAVFSLYTFPLSNYPTVNWVYWSLSCELAFYILIFIGLFLNKKYLIYFFIALSSVSLIITVPKISPYYFMLHWPTFALGLCIYYLTVQKQFKKILIYLLTLISLMALIKHSYLEGALPISYIITTILTCVLTFLSNKYYLRPNFFSSLGDYSYSIYLIHVPIGVYIFGLFKSEKIMSSIYLTIGYDLFTYSCISIIAYLMYMLIEFPSIKIGKKIAKIQQKYTNVVSKNNQ